MTDNPSKRQVDGWFVSGQPHEFAYFKVQIRQECPEFGDAAISEAIEFCRNEVAPSEGLSKLTERVRMRLRGY